MSDFTSPEHGSGSLDALARQVLDSIGEGCQVVGPNYRYLYVNDAAAAQGRSTREELLGRSMVEVYPGIDGTEMFARLRQCMEARAPQQMDNEFAFADGSKGWFELRFEPVPQGVTILSVDITRRKRTEAALQRSRRALSVLSECNQTLVRATDERRFMDDVCRIAVELGGYRMAWLGLEVAGAGQPLELVAHAGWNVGDTESGAGPVGRAIRSGKASIVNNIPTDEASAPWRQDAMERGYASCIALPIATDGETLGVLAIYAAEPEAFDDAEVKLLDELALDLGYGIGALRAKAERAWAQELSRTAFQGSPVAAVLLKLPARTIVDVNEAFERLFGWTRAEMIGRSIAEFDLWAVPAEREAAAVVLIRDGKLWAHEFVFKTRSGHTGTGLFYSEIFQVRGEQYALSKVVDITERKRAEQEARARQQLLTAFFEGSGALRAVFELDGEVLVPLMVNAQLAAVSTLDGDGPPASGREVTTPVEAEQVTAAARESLSTGRPVIFEFHEAEHRGGRWFLTTISPLGPGEMGKPRFTLVLNEITAQKAAEEARHLADARLRLVLSLVDVVVWAARPDGSEILEVTESFARVYGRSPEAFEADPGLWLEVVHPDDRAVAEQSRRDLFVNGYAKATYRIVRPDGEVRWLIDEKSAMLDADGVVLQIGGVAADITERMNLELELRDANASLEQRVAERTAELASARDEAEDLYENAPCGYHSIDPNGRFLRVNRTECEMLGYSRGELVGRLVTDLQWESDAIFTRADLASFFSTGSSPPREVRFRRKDGTPLDVLLQRTPVRGVHGAVIAARTTLADIGERKRLEGALQIAHDAALSANQAKSVFLSSMSHEIRTPLNAILGFSQLLLREPDLGNRQRAQLTSILRSGDQLLGLINDILEISRIEAGRLTLDDAALDLHAMLAELETSFEMRAEQKGLRLLFAHIEDVPRVVFGDEVKLRTVFNNLLSNAIKFTDHGGISVRLRAMPPNDGRFFMEVEVEDTGHGIDKADLPRLFTKFAQTNRGKLTAGGTGLGLAISREYVGLMGGELSVESQVDRGSVFRFRVLLTPADASAIRRVVAAQRVKCLRPGQERFKILVADDREDNREVLSQLLMQVGFDVHTVADGDAALREFEAWRPHLILMDMRMPVMDGYEATRRIRSLAGSDVVVFAITASAFEEDKADARAAGVDDFVGKPFREADLLAKIGTQLGAEYDHWEAPADDARAAERASPAAVDPAALRNLPSDLRSELQAATVSADVDRMLAILTTVAEYDAALAAALGAMTEQYNYARILALLDTEGGLK